VTDDRVSRRRNLATDDIAAIRLRHEAWLASKEQEGSPADLAGARIRGDALRGANLERADLTDADLEGVADLLAAQIAGAVLTRARLPDAVNASALEALKQADRIADGAHKLYLVLLGGCAYSVLTIATTNDAKLMTNSATSALPIIQTAVPIAGFFWVAPLLLTSMYFYFHLHLQRLWDALAELPAVFPEGFSLDRKIDPWLLTGLVRRHVGRLASEQPPFARFHNVITVVSAWWAVPATIVLFWARYLRRHDWSWTFVHVLVLASTVAGALLLYGVAKATLRRSERSGALRNPWRWAVAVVLVAIPAAAISVGSIEGTDDYVADEWPPFAKPRAWVPYLMERGFRYDVFAGLVDAEVSVKPQGWTDKADQIELVTGARLSFIDLRRARARRAFLVKADL
jgi:hypothetical protein